MTKLAVSAKLLLSRKTPREVLSRTMQLSQIQQEVLVGTLLGDGCLAKHGKHHRLHIKHKNAQRNLAEFKYETFREFISMPLHQFDQKLGGKNYPCVQFASRTNPIFSEWHSRFYQDGHKIVPKEIACYLTPLSLAVWFMDDGAADYAGVTIQTHSFTLSEVELLVSAVKESFGLEANSRKNKGHWLLYIKAVSLEHLEKTIKPYLLSNFEYKLIPTRDKTP
jgi:recombination protein RecA